jgi:hypothetical protein
MFHPCHILSVCLDYRAITLSTYGIIFLGMPHQGAESVDLALLLLQIQSIYSQTNDAVLKHLQNNSEFLQAQLSQYASISGNFDTKFCYEVYPTRIPGGTQRMASIDVSFEIAAPHIVVSTCPEVFCCHSGDRFLHTLSG